MTSDPTRAIDAALEAIGVPAREPVDACIDEPIPRRCRVPHRDPERRGSRRISMPCSKAAALDVPVRRLSWGAACRC